MIKTTKGKRGTLRRFGVSAGALVVGASVAGCVNVAEVSTLGANGSSTTTMTMTLNPNLGSLFGSLSGLFGGKISPAQMKQISQEISQTEAKFYSEIQQEIKAHKLPGQASVSTYTATNGWKGFKATFKLSTLKELEQLETSRMGSGAAPQFSTFSITSHGGVSTMTAKPNTASLAKSAGSLAPGAAGAQAGGNMEKLFQKMGLAYVISFKFPGKVISDNATSKAANGTLSWNMLKGPSTLKASWSS